ncbi:MAG: hypothetical protein OK456_00350 [Thaumarchaeota archaeon]|nr:hypothetical protein [Nitrososphaerota archaeon]
MSQGKAIGTTLVVLAVVIVIVIGTIAFVTLNAQSTHSPISFTSSTSSLTTSSTELSTASSSGSSTTYSNSSDSGLQLRVVMNASTIQTGDEVAVQIEVLNTLSHNVSLTDAPNQNISAWNGEYFFCGENPSHSLVGFALFDGHFTMGNISAAGSPLQLMAPAAIPCPASLPLSDTTFLPNSDETVSSSYQGQTLIGSSPVTAEVNATTGYCGITSSGSETTTSCSSTSGILGYWNPGFRYSGNMTLASNAFTHLLPGEYTIVAMDDWNGTVYAYFQVSGISLQNFSLCASNCVYPSPYLSGEIYFGGPLTAKSLELFVNGTDEGSLGHGIGNTNVIYMYKGSFQSPVVVVGDAYVITFVATFQDNSTATATTVVVAQ